LVYLLNLPYIP